MFIIEIEHKSVSEEQPYLQTDKLNYKNIFAVNKWEKI